MFTSLTPHSSPQGLRRASQALVRIGALLSLLLLALQPAPALAGADGAISGTLTFTAGGPVFNIPVVVYEAGGSEAGSDRTDASGNYLVDGLPAGNYVLKVIVENSGAVSEIYDDIPCPFPPCDEQTGDQVAVAASTTTTGIDFVLDRVARISGTITDDVSGLPVENAEVRAVSQATGTTFDFDFTDVNGEYLLEYPENQNTLIWAGGAGHAGEMYEDVPCEKDSPWTCNLATPDVVAFTLNTDLENVDLALDAWGSISGTVTRADGGTPFAGRSIRVWDTNGDLVETAVTDGSGDYTIEELPPGNYYVGYVSFENYLGELYNGVFCDTNAAELTCDTGAATLVASSLNTDTSGIDLELDRGGAIVGNVSLTEGSSAPVNSRSIRIYDTNGDEVARKSIGFDGDYSFTSIFPGTYFVGTHGFPTFLDELYDDFPCPESPPTDCDPTDGQGITLSIAETVQDVDFVLYPNLDGFGGKVRRDTDSFKLEGVQIDLWDSLGNLVASVDSAADGSYFFELAADTYYVSTTTDGSYENEVFSNMACPLGPASNGDCDPTAGTPIGVTNGGGPILGVDFDLTPTSMLFADGFESGNTTAWDNTVN